MSEIYKYVYIFDHQCNTPVAIAYFYKGETKQIIYQHHLRRLISYFITLHLLEERIYL